MTQRFRVGRFMKQNFSAMAKKYKRHNDEDDDFKYHKNDGQKQHQKQDHLDFEVNESGEEVKEQDDEEIARLNMKEALRNSSFGELKALQRRIGTKKFASDLQQVYNSVVFESDKKVAENSSHEKFRGSLQKTFDTKRNKKENKLEKNK